MRLLAIVSVLALTLVACGGGGSPHRTPTPTSTPQPRGFLPTYTPGITPPDPPSTLLGNAGKCPPLPRVACAQPGDTANLYADGSLERASAILLSRYSQPIRWVLDRDRVQTLLRMFDRQTYLFKYDILPLSDANHMRVEIIWPPNEGLPWGGQGSLDSVEFMIDSGPGLIGQNVIGLQWEMPPGFLDSLLASVSDITPTPLPRTPYLTPTPTRTVLPPRSIFFDQPADRLTWDGPDDTVWSSNFDHCSNYQLIQDFGIPGALTVDSKIGFWAIDIEQPPPSDLRWTGYYHGDWQLWQGNNPEVIYLLYMGEPRVAFKYQAMVCF